MRWTIEYFEQVDTTQPAEVFEDEEYLRTHRISPIQEEDDE